MTNMRQDAGAPTPVTTAAVAAVVGGAMMAIGAFLPWVTASTGFGSLSVSGMEGDGILVLIAGGIAVAAALMSLYSTGPWWAVVAVVSVIGGVICLVDMQDVQARIGAVESQYVVAQVGIGLWLCLAGSVVGLVGSLAIGLLRGESAEQGAPALSSLSTGRLGWYSAPDPAGPRPYKSGGYAPSTGKPRPGSTMWAYPDSEYASGAVATEETLANARALASMNARSGKFLVEAVWQDSAYTKLGLAFGEPGVEYERKWPTGDDVKDLVVPPKPEPPGQPAPQPPEDLSASPAPPSTPVPPPAESSVSEAPDRPTKVCPDCAETVLRDARICRFCRYVFEREMPPFGADDSDRRRCGGRDSRTHQRTALAATPCARAAGSFTGATAAVRGVASGAAPSASTSPTGPASTAVAATASCPVVAATAPFPAVATAARRNPTPRGSDATGQPSSRPTDRRSRETSRVSGGEGQPHGRQHGSRLRLQWRS